MTRMLAPLPGPLRLPVPAAPPPRLRPLRGRGDQCLLRFLSITAAPTPQ
jgi:hypothetical protein